MSSDHSCFAFLCTGDDHRPAAKKKEKKNKKKDKKLAPPSPNPILRNDSPDDEDVAEVSVPVGPLPGGQRRSVYPWVLYLGAREQLVPKTWRRWAEGIRLEWISVFQVLY